MTTLINDTHLGVSRTAGTTPKSQAALREWQFEQFESLLNTAQGQLIINGDLFDTFNVDNAALLRTFQLLEAWCTSSGNRRLVLVAGNHDLSKDSGKLSSFHLLGSLLPQHKTRVVLEPAMLDGDIYVIPHLPNQDLFDVALLNVPSSSKLLLVHCNYDNRFAQQADHSLDLSREQALRMPCPIIFGHEHQQRRELDGKVLVVGNQIPTSVADCLGPARKYLCHIQNGHATPQPWLDIPLHYAQVDWRELKAFTKRMKFIRVCGEASAQEAVDVLTAVSRFRSKSEAFVVTNAVKIEGADIMEGVAQSLENATSFDVFEAVLSMLDEQERAVVRRLHEGSRA
jgi:DNA repair exonuclease SbcCD nuclease subunit